VGNAWLMLELYYASIIQIQNLPFFFSVFILFIFVKWYAGRRSQIFILMLTFTKFMYQLIIYVQFFLMILYFVCEQQVIFQWIAPFMTVYFMFITRVLFSMKKIGFSMTRELITMANHWISVLEKDL